MLKFLATGELYCRWIVYFYAWRLQGWW